MIDRRCRRRLAHPLLGLALLGVVPAAAGPRLDLVSAEAATARGTGLVLELPVGRLDEPAGGTGALELLVALWLDGAPIDRRAGAAPAAPAGGVAWSLAVLPDRLRLAARIPDGTSERETDRRVAAATRLLLDVVEDPAEVVRSLSEPELRHARRRLALALQSQARDPASRRERAFRRLAWGEHGGASPTAWSVSALGRRDLHEVAVRAGTRHPRLAVAGSGRSVARRLAERAATVRARAPLAGPVPDAGASLVLETPAAGTARLFAVLPVAAGASGPAPVAAIELVRRRLRGAELHLATRERPPAWSVPGDVLVLELPLAMHAHRTAPAFRLPRLLDVIGRGSNELGVRRVAEALDGATPLPGDGLEQAHLALDLLAREVGRDGVELDLASARASALELDVEGVRAAAAEMAAGTSWLAELAPATLAPAEMAEAPRLRGPASATPEDEARWRATAPELHAAARALLGDSLPAWDDPGLAAALPAAFTRQASLSGARRGELRLDLVLAAPTGVRRELRGGGKPEVEAVAAEPLPRHRSGGSDAQAVLRREALVEPAALVTGALRGLFPARPGRGPSEIDVLVPEAGEYGLRLRTLPDGRADVVRVDERDGSLVASRLRVTDIHEDPEKRGVRRATRRRLVRAGREETQERLRLEAWSAPFDPTAVETDARDLARDRSHVTLRAGSWPRTEPDAP